MGERNLLESWLATYRRRMVGTVQFAAALVTQPFEVTLGKRATSHRSSQEAVIRLQPVINRDTGYTAAYGGVL